MKPSVYLERKCQVEFGHDVEEMLDREVQTVSFPAGHTVLWEGDSAACLYYMIKGLVRGYYTDKKGNDLTKCFCAEDEFFSTEGFRTASPATFTIECLEDCRCLRLSYEFLTRIINCHENVGSFVSRLFQMEVSRQESRNKSLMLLSAEERYLAFCSDYPHLYERLPLKYIASYIGVHAASLSRIRKNKKRSIHIGE